MERNEYQEPAVRAQRERQAMVLRLNKDKFYVCREALGAGYYEVLAECQSLEQARPIWETMLTSGEQRVIVRENDKAWLICYRTDWHYALHAKCRTQFGADYVLQKLLARVPRQ